MHRMVSAGSTVTLHIPLTTGEFREFAVAAVNMNGESWATRHVAVASAPGLNRRTGGPE